jgi:hypothetical protein
MYCNKCGAPIPEGASFCQKCGAPVEPSAAPARTPSAVSDQPVTTIAPSRTSGFAIAALVLGIIGFLINFLSILAIIFGALGMSHTGKDPALKGRGMAVAGLVLGIIVVFIWIFIIFWVGFSFFWWL